MTDRATQQRHPRHRTWAEDCDQRASVDPHQAQAAGELVRVSRRSGRIGLASWVPDGFAGLVPLDSSVGTLVAFG